MTKKATNQVQRMKNDPAPGRLVAELPLGFWVGLFANAYDQTLWRTDLHRLFKPRPKRQQLHDNLDRLRTLRNRIAHHEPIFQRDLVADYNRAREVIHALSPELCTWMESHARVFDVIAAPLYNTRDSESSACGKMMVMPGSSSLPCKWRQHPSSARIRTCLLPLGLGLPRTEGRRGIPCPASFGSSMPDPGQRPEGQGRGWMANSVPASRITSKRYWPNERSQRIR